MGREDGSGTGFIAAAFSLADGSVFPHQLAAVRLSAGKQKGSVLFLGNQDHQAIDERGALSAQGLQIIGFQIVEGFLGDENRAAIGADFSQSVRITR